MSGLLRALAAGHRVRLLVPGDVKHAPPGVARLQAEVGVEVETFASPRPARRGMAAVALWLRCVVRRVPPWVLVNTDPQLVRRMQDLASEIDAIVILDDYAGVYLILAGDKAGRVPTIADKHAVCGRPTGVGDEGARGSRERLVRWLITSFERRYLARADSVIVSSSEEAAWLRKLYGRDANGIVPSAVDVPPPQRGLTAASGRVGWLSSLDAPENVDGLRRFVTCGWPLLGERGYELAVAGRNPPAQLDDLASVPGVRLIGYVSSLDDFLYGLDAAVIPLWRGRGVKLKTLTLMAAGLPVVATPMAVEGLDVEHGIHCMVGDTPEELAAHLATILGDRELGRRLGAAGRELVMVRYTWDVVGPQFSEIVDRALTSKATS